jgi:hypothetical protein
MHRLCASLAVALTVGLLPPPAEAGLRAEFLYELSDTNGTLPISWATPVWDEEHAELYVVDPASGLVNVFNHNGMAIYQFGEDMGGLSARGILPTDGGDLIVLASDAKGAWKLLVCSYRGEPKREIPVRGLTPSFEQGFGPTVLRQALGRIYLADIGSKKVAILGADGTVQDTLDLGALLNLSERKSRDNEIRALNVDPLGNVLFTIPTLFSAYVVSPQGQVRNFGQRGSAPGHFNIVAGIAADEQGTLFLTDILRSVVMVFDRGFHFLGEFGYRGDSPTSLTNPLELSAAGGQLFVAQSVGGMKVYSVHLD